MCHRYWLFILLPVSYCHALIVPQELPSILSLIFSTIPQVRKGTDSRLGFGFRLGEHADLQVMLELGPQKETRPIGPNSLSQNSKRHVNQDDYEQSDEKLINKNDSGTSSSSGPSTNKEAESWLKDWSNGMRSKRKKNIPTPPTFVMAAMNKDENDKNKIKVAPIISETALKQLQTLYGKNTSDSSEEIQANKSDSLTERPLNKSKDQITAELSDVTLD